MVSLPCSKRYSYAPREIFGQMHCQLILSNSVSRTLHRATLDSPRLRTIAKGRSRIVYGSSQRGVSLLGGQVRISCAEFRLDAEESQRNGTRADSNGLVVPRPKEDFDYCVLKTQ